MMTVTVTEQAWPLAEPFTVARGTQVEQPVLRLTLDDGTGSIGRGEACGVYYAGDTIETMRASLAAALPVLRRGVSRGDLAGSIASGGARHLVDAALWDLEAKAHRTDAFAMAGVSPRPVTTARTIGIRSLPAYRQAARDLADHAMLKIKLDATRPLEVIAVIRQEAPTTRLIVDPNQSWSVDQLKAWTPALADFGVEMIEQPVAVGAEDGLDGWISPVPLCADELVDGVEDLNKARGRFAVVNIKLDKCGGLTAGLALARAARDQGFGLMVGCMGGSSLSMAPAMVLAQLCDFVDLDGPLLQRDDIADGFRYEAGRVARPLKPELWG